MILITLDKRIAGFAHETGGHRIQRVPPTEKRGRVHTSTVTCAVIDGARSASTGQRPDEEFEWRWHRGSGSGGQHRNKHACCLELKHLPSGLTQAANGRSRETNAKEAMALLLGRLNAHHDTGQAAQTNQLRSSQIGLGMRGNKRRTYRFQEDQIHDHETGRKTSCSAFMRGRIDALWHQ